jgi:fructoselysine-6-P-deglycase FrlB-like protein
MNVGGFIKQALPWIGAAATGNIPVLIQLAAGTVGKVVGKSVSANVEDISAAIAGATPEQLLALKQADNELAEKMQQMGFQHVEDLEKIAADDRASARAREVSLKDRFVPFLATFVLASFTVAVLAVIRGWGKIEAAFAGTLIGYLAANANQVVGYYFGSSAAHDALTANKKAE